MKYVDSKMPHYGLRKLSIGVASVLLGMTVTGILGYADVPVNNSKNVSVDESVSDSNLNGSNHRRLCQRIKIRSLSCLIRHL